ncbi:MAG: FIST N-terminal domain-containing protein [Candidatus Thiothrix putei]|uniref:FIST N-terminal domain-containing protein n=1 Tax=Candidatus Thiothrix putei TaxID=3080811 RepID=A0AA95HJ27_9GAMM|nr:MAG: FIST N-terminal domain-containing protein [Candidatus Thiothrix putei]
MQVTLSFFTHATGWHKPLPDIDSPQTLVLIFSPPDSKYYQAALEQLHAHYPQAVIAGCSTVAGIFNEHLLDNALVVGVIRFKTTRLAFASAALPHVNDSFQAGQQIANDLNSPDLKGIFILTDGLNTNGSELIRGLASVVNETNVTIVGGLASDKMQFVSTWILHQGQATSLCVSGVGFYGKELVFNSYARDGFKPFGPERVITRAAGNTLYEIDGRPALQLYKEYLGEHADNLPATALHFPLAIWNQTKDHYVVRTVVSINEADNSLGFVADIPQGYGTQLMYGSFDNLLDGAETASRSLAEQLPPQTPVFALTISCSGRKLVMGDDVDQELEATLENLPAGSQQLGFYSYGELAPTALGGQCCLHNETMTLTVMYEGS